ncbi:hypothetical protein [Sporolactobacillus vineae]|uniref:hypothetical protein n=1 Tax=Sporolactobacillus vineae TaxID=444463 RepID=UPI00028918CF|nr:hypothetical protein [Sporolactobacillus vineae]
MSFIGVVIAVVAFIFYVARSVEKQNAQEMKRRERMRGNRPVPGTRAAARVEKQTTKTRSDNRTASADPPERAGSGRTMMQNYQEALERAGQTAPLRPAHPSDSITGTDPISVSPVVDHRPRWLQDPQAVRRAFIFSECIGRPRSLNPHPYFRKIK